MAFRSVQGIRLTAASQSVQNLGRYHYRGRRRRGKGSLPLPFRYMQRVPFAYILGL